jgi:pimeloyl-ACP methyl ester carboxylesterase
MARRRSPLAAVLVLGLLAAACGGGDDGDDTAADASSTTVTTGATGGAGVGPNGFRPDPIEWQDCGADECAEVEVPLDYDAPDGERITISVLRVPASGQREGALFVNPGGPGASATEFASQIGTLLPEAIPEHFDLVGVEPRGLDGSAPLDCGLDYEDVYGVDPTVEDAGDRATLVQTATEVADACEASAGERLAHVGTRDVARDIDTVRAAMGDPTLSYYGGSYGTAIGQVYAELFPQNIRGMVLDAVVELGPSGLELAAAQAEGFETALERFVAHCTTSGECTTDDPLGAVEEALQLAERPGGIPAPDANRPAGPGETSLGISAALYSEQLWPVLDRALDGAQDGDGSGLVELADYYLGIGDFDVYFAVNCLDFAWPTGDPDAFLAAAKAANGGAPHFGEALVTDYLRCVDWPVAPEPLTPVTAPGTPPILVISTTGDPATPYEQGVAVAERLENGVLVTNEAEGHGAVGSQIGCIDAIFAAYLLDGTVPEDGIVCD